MTRLPKRAIKTKDMTSDDLNDPRRQRIYTPAIDMHDFINFRARCIAEGISMTAVLKMLVQAWGNSEPAIVEYIIETHATRKKIKQKIRARERKATVDRIKMGRVKAEEIRFEEEFHTGSNLTEGEIKDLYDVLEASDPLEDI